MSNMPPQKIVYRLTNREKQVLKLVVDGYTNVEAGLILGLSRRTVEAHRARIMLKLDLHDLPALVKYTIREGMTTEIAHRTTDSQLIAARASSKAKLKLRHRSVRSANRNHKQKLEK
jgi:DNA-binding NarL/FixJ family response regulator